MQLRRAQSRVNAVRMNVAVGLILSLAGVSMAAEDPALMVDVPLPRWAVDPHGVGPQLPPVGRSLFDFLVTDERNGKREYNVPFPYTALIERIEKKLHGPAGAAQVKQVLIPLGRSLQRNAAAPDFFKFPRVVAAIDTEAEAGGDVSMFLKDRVYIGFGEKSAVLEVISYNEAAGRFEFQVVNDYRPGGTPRVAYADRAICISCHQNEALVFSRQNWDETNANPKVARRLKQEGKSFHGVTIERGVDVPFAIDQATNRANLFAVTQLLWREGCGDGEEGDRCRATAFGLALQYRMTGDRDFDAQSQRARFTLNDVLMRRFRTQWPGGLLIPDPDLPNRDPLIEVPHDGAVAPPLNAALDTKGKQLLTRLLENTDIASPFEPLDPRDPMETWSATDRMIATHFVRGLAEFIAVSDARRVDSQLAKLPIDKTNALPAAAGADCAMSIRVIDAQQTRVAFDCAAPANSKLPLKLAGRVYARGGDVTEGSIEVMEIDGSQLNALEVGPGSRLERGAGGWKLKLQARSGTSRARTGTGAVVQDVEVTAPGALRDGSTPQGKARVVLRQDFVRIWQAIDAIREVDRESFGAKPFRRAVVMPALLAQLGEAPGAWCCAAAGDMPPIVDDRTTPAPTTGN